VRTQSPALKLEQYRRSVFINCPFDADYQPILQAILFCILYFNFIPRLTLERSNSREPRLDKIRELIEAAQYSIHDLSRCRANEKDEYYRLNMPFELGLDFGCQQWASEHSAKKFLIFEGEKDSYDKSISDLSGLDIKNHNHKTYEAVVELQGFLIHDANAQEFNVFSDKHKSGPSAVLSQYEDFLGCYWQRKLEDGYTEAEIKMYGARDLIDAMRDWLNENRPQPPK
jgi:hypothetical protein